MRNTINTLTSRSPPWAAAGSRAPPAAGSRAWARRTGSGLRSPAAGQGPSPGTSASGSGLLKTTGNSRGVNLARKGF